MGEGWNASVAVTRLPGGVLNYHNAGKVQASSEPQDMRLQRMLGHLTTLIPKSPKKVLVIGCGAGVTAGAVSIDPYLEQETIAEIEPLVPKVVSTYFAEHNFSVITNPKVHVQLDDARHYLLTTNEKFDAITSDPLDPWVKGAAMLYTREFFEIVKQHLNPGGVVTLFVQLYESNTEAVKSEIATFMEAFPNGVVWGNTQDGRGYDLVLMGTVEPLQINVDEIEAKLKRPEYAPVGQVAGRDRDVQRHRPVRDLRGARAGSDGVDARRDHQSRSQPQAAVSRRAGPQPLSERPDLLRDARPRQVSRGAVHRQRRDAGAAARGNRPRAGPRDGAIDGAGRARRVEGGRTS